MAGIAIALALACGPAVTTPAVTSSAGASSSTTSDGDVVTSIEPLTTSTTTAESTSSVDSSTLGDASAAFIPATDVGGNFECDHWAQDCPVGMKCMPWANDGGSSWNALRCSEIVDDPKGVGEPCTVVDSQVSGIDDCGFRSMCWDVDPDTLMGTCVSLCQGSESNPTCNDPCDQCPLGGEGVLILCLPSCDPVVQDCGDGEACHPFDDGFRCFPDAGGSSGAPGEPCEFVNVCDPGTACIGAEQLPDCQGPSCCSEFCDVEAADECPASIPGTVCTPWFHGNESNGCFASTVGVCALP